VKEFLFPFLVASVWATVGAMLTRVYFKADYSRVAVFWLMSVFAFTFANQIALFQLLSLRTALLAASLGAVTPIVAHRCFPDGRQTDEPERAWSRWVFGGLVCAAAAICAFGASNILHQVAHLSQSSPTSSTHLMALLAAILALGFVGAVTVLPKKSRGSSRSIEP